MNLPLAPTRPDPSVPNDGRPPVGDTPVWDASAGVPQMPYAANVPVDAGLGMIQQAYQAIRQGAERGVGATEALNAIASPTAMADQIAQMVAQTQVPPQGQPQVQHPDRGNVSLNQSTDPMAALANISPELVAMFRQQAQPQAPTQVALTPSPTQPPQATPPPPPAPSPVDKLAEQMQAFIATQKAEAEWRQQQARAEQARQAQWAQSEEAQMQQRAWLMRELGVPDEIQRSPLGNFIFDAHQQAQQATQQAQWAVQQMQAMQQAQQAMTYRSQIESQLGSKVTDAQQRSQLADLAFDLVRSGYAPQQAIERVTALLPTPPPAAPTQPAPPPSVSPEVLRLSQQLAASSAAAAPRGGFSGLPGLPGPNGQQLNIADFERFMFSQPRFG